MQALGTASLNGMLWQPAGPARPGPAPGSAFDRGAGSQDDRPARLSAADCPARPPYEMDDVPPAEPAVATPHRDAAEEPAASAGGAGLASDGSAKASEAAKNTHGNAISNRSSPVMKPKRASGAGAKPQAGPKGVVSGPETVPFAVAMAAQLVGSTSTTAGAGRRNGTGATTLCAGRIVTGPGMKAAANTPAADTKTAKPATTAVAGGAEKRAGQAFIAASAVKVTSHGSAVTAAKANASGRTPQTKGEGEARPTTAAGAGEKTPAQPVSQVAEKILTVQSARTTQPNPKAAVAVQAARPLDEKAAGQAGKAGARQVPAGDPVAAGPQKKPTAMAAKADRADGQPAVTQAPRGMAAETPAVEGRGEAVAAAQPLSPSDAASMTRLSAARPAEAGPMDRGLGDVAGQVAESIRASGGPTDRQILVNLNPPELGQVRIVLRSEADGIRGVIHAEEAETLSRLQQEAAPLLARLSGDGIEIRRLDFGLIQQQSGHQADAGAAFRDGQAQADAWAGEHGPHAGGAGDASGVASGGSEATAETDAGATGIVWNTVSGSVDVQV